MCFCVWEKSVAEIFLRLLFFWGLRDTAIQTNILQETSTWPYGENGEIFDIASSIESVNLESLMVEHNSLSFCTEPLH